MVQPVSRRPRCRRMVTTGRRRHASGSGAKSASAQILKDLGISSIRLLTSADHHYVGLAGFGIEISATEPIG